MSTVASSPQKPSKRLELESLIKEFQSKLGNDWDKYHEALSLFLIGKLSRDELVRDITPILKNGLVKYHNKLLLLNFANSLKDGPIDFQNEFASFWNKKAIKSKNVRSSQYEKFKQNIMRLPIRERRRIKNITRESGKKGKLSASITLTRHALLPKIPMIQDKEQQQLQVNNLVQWQQDVLNGINTAICTDNFELPESDNLSKRVLMMMREYGLTGGLNSQVMDVISLGLESYLTNIIENAIDVTKYRANKYTTNDFLAATSDKLDTIEEENGPSRKKKKVKKTVMNIEDLYNTLEMFPHLTEPSGSKYRLSSVMLQNDDEVSETYKLPPRIEPVIEEVNGTIKKDEEKKETPSEVKKEEPTEKPGQKPTPDTSHIGTTDELKWMLHDLITTM